jgi:hypothetical protein
MVKVYEVPWRQETAQAQNAQLADISATSALKPAI